MKNIKYTTAHIIVSLLVVSAAATHVNAAPTPSLKATVTPKDQAAKPIDDTIKTIKEKIENKVEEMRSACRVWTSDRRSDFSKQSFKTNTLYPRRRRNYQR